jgi:peptidoglycan hydrolase-like protein with peptidoglycan-binding domain
MLTVDRAQELLSALGYDPGPHDGVLGPKTSSAIRHFQADHGLPQTGTLDVLTTEQLIAVAVDKGVDKKMPWWGWAMIAVGASLAIWGAYKLATHKRSEREEELLRKLSDLRPTDAFLLPPVHRSSEARWPEPVSSRGVVSSSAPTLDLAPSAPVATPAPASVRHYQPPPATVRSPEPSFVPSARLEPVASGPSAPSTLVDDLPPPPRRATLAEMLDIQAEAERRARALSSPKSSRYDDVLENERRRVIDEHFGRR